MMRALLAVLVCGGLGVGAYGQAITGAVPLSGEAPEAEGYRLETVVGGLEHPWGMCWLPGAPGESRDLLVTERAGRVRLVRDGKLVVRAVAEVPGVLQHGQGGLMDISLHPDFAHNGFVYLTYSVGEKERNQTVLGRATYDGGRLDDFEVLFEPNVWKSGGQHFGSRVVWLPDGTLLMSLGDGGNPPVRYDGDWIRKQAQNPGTHNGSVLHLTDEGKPARPDGYVDGGVAEVFSYGHRNIQGIVRDPLTGRVWANEHGANGGDELNLVEAGANYGWPVATYSREYFGPRITETTSEEGMVDPLVVWTPCKAPSGLALYSGDAFPQWKGDLFSGALRGQHIRRIDLENGEVVGQEEIRTGARVRDVRQGPDGLIYYLTDEGDGALMRVVPE